MWRQANVFLDISPELVFARSSDYVRYYLEYHGKYRIGHEYPVLHNVRSLEVAKALIQYGANVNAVDKYGETALHRVHGPNIAKLLILHGADINAINHNGHVPLYYARGRMFKYLIKAGASMYGILYHSSPYKLKYMIQHGYDVNTSSDDWTTPLHIVNTASKACILLEAGASVSARDLTGRTPVLTAKNVKILQLLLKYGASLCDTDDKGRNILHLTFSKNVASYAIKHSPVLLDMVDRDGNTPMHVNRSLDVLRFLFEQRPSMLYSNNSTGALPVQSHSSLNAVHALLCFGDHDKTVLASIARRQQQKDWDRMLVYHGLDLANTADIFGNTPAHHSGAKYLFKPTNLTHVNYKGQTALQVHGVNSGLIEKGAWGLEIGVYFPSQIAILFAFGGPSVFETL